MQSGIGQPRRAVAASSAGARSATCTATTPLHLGFPKAVWHELYDQGRIDYHPVFPGKPGYASRQIENEDDVRDAIALLRLNYDRAVATHGLPEREPVGS